jgi:hypothetical protein
MFRDLFFECPPLLFRLAQLYLERFILKSKRFIFRLQSDYFLSEYRRKRNFCQQIEDRHVLAPNV